MAYYTNFFQPVLMMSAVCSFWLRLMNPNMPATSEVPIFNYVVGYIAFMLITDVNFWMFHRLLHRNRFLYTTIHSRHHEIKHGRMEALHYVEQHPVEMLVSVMPVWYFTYLFPGLFPSWFVTFLIYHVHSMGLAAHSMTIFYDTKNPLFYAILPFSFPLVVVSVILRFLGIPGMLSSPARHHLHHKSPLYNYGLTFTIMDRWMRTMKTTSEKATDVSARKTTRHEINLLVIFFQVAAILSRRELQDSSESLFWWQDSGWFASYAVYCVGLWIELVQPETNKFLRHVHHPLALLLAVISASLNLVPAARFVVLSNISQAPLFLALALERGHGLAAWMVLPVKLCIGCWTARNLLQDNLLFPNTIQLVFVAIGTAMQVKGAHDVVQKGRSIRGKGRIN
jgi:sterol desaturase/sphingolipid hydroxylase (fatty acid hydroxylase superfamily)